MDLLESRPAEYLSGKSVAVFTPVNTIVSIYLRDKIAPLVPIDACAELVHRKEIHDVRKDRPLLVKHTDALPSVQIEHQLNRTAVS